MTAVGWLVAAVGWSVALVGWGVTLRICARTIRQRDAWRDAAVFWRGVVLLIVTPARGDT